MEKIALSIEQMKHLKTLGVDTSNASMFYVPKLEPKGEYILLNVNPSNLVKSIPTFILQDILELLPKEIDEVPLIIDIGNNKIEYFQYDIPYVQEEVLLYQEYYKKNPLIDAVYNTLCWVAENGYLVNKQ